MTRRENRAQEIILTHAGADFDGLASMVCARKLYPAARMLLCGAVDPTVREFLAMYRAHFPVETARAVEKIDIARLILVDVQVPSRLGEFRERVAQPGIEVHVYDHHPPTLESVRGDYACIETVGATTTILVEKLAEKEAQVSPMEATLFALGIYEETGSLTFPDTTTRDLQAVAWLLERGANLQMVSDYMHHTLRAEQRELLNALLGSAQTHVIKGVQVLIACGEREDFLGELAGLAHRMMDLERPDTLIVIVRMKQRVYVVGRSRELGFNVATVMQRLGGGGHMRAASASVRGSTVHEVRGEVLRLLRELPTAAVSARAVMSAPVQHIDVTDSLPTMEEARGLLVRYGHSALPVLREGALVGLLGRREVDKAVNHGLGHAPLTAFLAPAPETVSPDTALAELQRRFADEQVSRIPVVDEGRLVGIVTRTDLLEALYGQQPAPPASEVERDTLDRLAALPEFLQRLLREAGRVGDALDLPVYAVGGFVRDVLLGVENLDLDLVVEGDGIRYAQTLAQALGGRSRPHEKFQTAVVVAAIRGRETDPYGAEPREIKIDVASSRLEFYTRPAALPDVVGSTLKQDLWRRDFTINAMAIGVNSYHYGKLFDFFAARRDLRDGVVRVLHSLSFVDDPTRIFRAIKFEQRYHFRMDPHTESLLRRAISDELLEQLSPKRIRGEFTQILSELRPLPAILRMDQLRVLRLIHPRLRMSERVRDLLESVTATLLPYEDMIRSEGLQRWLIYFRALIAGLSEEAMDEVGERYRISTDSRRRMLLSRETVRHLLRRLYRTRLLPSEVHALLSPLPLEMVLYLLARCKARPIKEKVMLFLDRLRHARPLVRGSDLRAWGIPPGRELGKALQVLMNAQLDGKIRTREEAREYLEEQEIVANWT